MSYYNKTNNAISYSCDLIASDVNEIAKDSYSISIHYRLNVATNEMSYQATVV